MFNIATPDEIREQIWLNIWQETISFFLFVAFNWCITNTHWLLVGYLQINYKSIGYLLAIYKGSFIIKWYQTRFCKNIIFLDVSYN